MYAGQVISALQTSATEIEGAHLRDLLGDAERCEAMTCECEGLFMDYSRQRVDKNTMDLLFKLASCTGVEEKRAAMLSGQKINRTEGRAVMHAALRAPRDQVINVDGTNVVGPVHDVLDRIADFSARVRDGKWVGSTGKPLTTVLSIGIGGSYLGPDFVSEALKTDAEAAVAAEGRELRFLANVDPADFERAVKGLDAETTLVVIVSKTFTTAETMLNARTVKEWLLRSVSGDGSDAFKESVIRQHVVAVSASLDKTEKFGIDPSNVFGFWDWVGGRFSVWSAVGMLPLALQYGFPVMEKFLQGGHAMDEHFAQAPADKNLPVIMGLLGVWNSTFLGYSCRAILPYSQALLRFPAHIQQVDMESNGKRVAMDGSALPYDAGEIIFGEPGTNGQHSFYQLMHQGRAIPAEFIGLCESPTPKHLDGEPVSNHDELMSNFFAQPDALACGKTIEELKSDGVAEELLAHKEFPGNRPSLSLLMQRLDAFSAGQLLALYEHRVAVQGFVWGINSFDQWGVELGKVLAKQVRTTLQDKRGKPAEISGFNPSTTTLLKRFLSTDA